MRPIGQFKSGIPRLTRRVVLLGWYYWRAKYVAPCFRIEESIRVHELCRLKNYQPVPFQRSTIRMGLVTEFRVEDGMRLLPDQQRPDWRRAVAPLRSNHLGPARAAIA